jgi:hypothetical protein
MKKLIMYMHYVTSNAKQGVISYFSARKKGLSEKEILRMFLRHIEAANQK